MNYIPISTPFFIYNKINHKAWYGCFMNNNKMNCYGPNNSYISTELLLKIKMGDTFNKIPSAIISTCMFMPEFMIKIKLNKKIFSDTTIPIIILKS